MEIKYVDEDTFNRLKELRYWSLFAYHDSQIVKHYCILWGTVSLLNHDDFATGRFSVLNNELDDMETGFRLSYNYNELTIDHGNCTSILDVLSLQVDRVDDAFIAGEMEGHADLYARLNLQDRNYYGYRIHLVVKYPTLKKFFLRVFPQHGLMLQYFLIIGRSTQDSGLSSRRQNSNHENS